MSQIAVTPARSLGSIYNGVARLGPRAMVRAGDRVTFGVEASRLHFFDPVTGAAVGCPAIRDRVA